MLDPLVSIVIPTHNRPEMLRRAVRSAQDQTYSNIEIIIVDDASFPSAADAVKSLQKTDSRIRCIRNPRSLGGAGARNVGIGRARGKYIAFLDDDDIWKAEKTSRQVEALEKSQGDACSCGFFFRRFGCSRSRYIPSKAPSFENLLASNFLGGASVCMASKRALEAIRGFDTGLRSGQDWDLWLRLAKIGRIELVPDALLEYDAHFGIRISTNMRGKISGSRKIYFKYRKLMNKECRKNHIGMILFYKSRMPDNGCEERIRLLYKATSLVNSRLAITMTASGLLRLALPPELNSDLKNII